MTHDIDDLLDIIEGLEERIILLERLNTLQAEKLRTLNHDDSWYWEHG